MSIEFDKEQPGKTNLEHIKEMNAEEFIKATRRICYFCIYKNVNCIGNPDVDCDKGCLEYLNQPYEGDVNEI